MNKKEIHLPLCLQLKGKRKIVRHNLKVLRNGLITSKVKFVNPLFENEFIECEALIDIGAEITVICETLLSRFTIDAEQIQNIGISTVNADEENLQLYPFRVHVPSHEWHSESVEVIARNLKTRIEYDAIIGIDILRHSKIYYDGVQGLASIDI